VADEQAAFETLDAMRARADEVVPSATLGTVRGTAAFLGVGSAGEWRERVTPTDVEGCDQRVAELADAVLAAWLDHVASNSVYARGLPVSPAGDARASASAMPCPATAWRHRDTAPMAARSQRSAWGGTAVSMTGRATAGR
jgi:hypothetical protein